MKPKSYIKIPGATESDTSREPGGRADGQPDHASIREHNLDKTIEDSFPASDPPSTDPNPDGRE